ncbi:glycosyltransferase family A protein [Trujillonella endophytica]|uniref:Glycosyl transferase family 2 n=1 Tax=Trujillonella endophytica TaxID=673521 RepID=A0A1H8W184_9ACTN|nr:glycosyltransferase family A protein [Trujillella endophytica]SEP21409.1 Glycosyl transferase family 2 [Trujillella endophytica]
MVINHDYGDYVLDAVRSLTQQSVPFAEVVVVDDGSTDHSLAVLQTLPREVRLLRKANGGQLSAALTALAEVGADYVYFLDADDRALPDLVARVTPDLAGRPVKAQFQLQGVAADLTPTGSVFPTFPSGYDSARMREDNARLGFYVCPPTSGNVYRCDVLRGMPLRELDQWDFVDGVPAMVQPELGAVVSIPEPLAQYRVHDRNHSSWARPTVGQLEEETARFSHRWKEADAVLGIDVPFSAHAPAFVVERRLMTAALSGQPVSGHAIALVRRLWSSHLPFLHKVALSAWAVGFVPPVASWRRTSVDRRRSPSGRSRAMRTAIRLLRGFRSG